MLRSSKNDLTPVVFFSADCSKAVPLWRFFLARSSVVSEVVFVLLLFVSHLNFSTWDENVLFRDCGIP